MRMRDLRHCSFKIIIFCARSNGLRSHRHFSILSYKAVLFLRISPKAAEFALNALGVKAVIIKTFHEEQEFAHLHNILMFVTIMMKRDWALFV